jgi:hypothetical protein
MSSLAGVLPLKVSGRHYGDNLARLDMLFSSLLHFGAPGLLDELVVVARADEVDVIERHLRQWPDLPLRIVVEDEHFPAFRRFQRPWQVRPWQRQQIIKLNAPALTSADFVLTLDPDVLAIRSVDREALLPGGRALLEPEPRSTHRQWWLDSADLLEVEPALERPGMNVSPALLSTTVLREVHRRLETVGGRPWMDVLLTSYCDWTEYTLYLLAAERAGLVAGAHLWSDDPGAPARLHSDPTLSIWGAAEATRANVERLFTAGGAGIFAVVQSNTGLPASEVAAVAARHFPVRRTTTPPLPPAGRRSKVKERLRTASRLAAVRIYRLRRRVRRRGLPLGHPSGSPQVEPPSIR